jgi:tRNA (guanine37-N1)-methyltransferase
VKFTILTLFPEITNAYFANSIMAKALEKGIIRYRAVNIRDFAPDKHKTCDDAPYGGGPGMLMLAEPLKGALESVGATPRPPAGADAAHTASASADVPTDSPRPHVIYLTPSGKPFTQKRAQELAAMEELVLICGRYEGIDQRIIDTYVDEELSVGDYILSSGEVAALAVVDTVYRLVDRVITPESLEEESFSGGLLEYPQFTRPEIFDNIKVPELLLSGHHENIRRWRLKKRVEKTFSIRPDLLEQGLQKGLFDAETVKLIQEVRGKYDERN